MEVYGRGWFLEQNMETEASMLLGLESYKLYSLYKSDDIPEDDVIVQLGRTIYLTMPEDHFLLESGNCYFGEFDTIIFSETGVTTSVCVLQIEEETLTATKKILEPEWFERCGYGIWEIVDIFGDRYFLLDLSAENEDLDLPLEHIGTSMFKRVPNKKQPFVFYSIIPYPGIVQNGIMRMISPICVYPVLSVEKIINNIFKISGMAFSFFGYGNDYIEAYVSI